MAHYFDVISCGLEHFSSDVANTLYLFATCKLGIQDSLGFWIPRSVFHIPGTTFQYLSVELGFWTLIVSGIPDSMLSKIFPVSGFPYSWGELVQAKQDERES